MTKEEEEGANVSCQEKLRHCSMQHFNMAGEGSGLEGGTPGSKGSLDESKTW